MTFRRKQDRIGSRASAIAYLMQLRRDLREPPGSQRDLDLSAAISLLTYAGEHSRDWVQNYIRGFFGRGER